MKPAAPSPHEKHYTPGKFSAALERCGITLHPVTVRRRCQLPVGDPLRIQVNPPFPFRIYIPESELSRFVPKQNHEQH
jgi:hypothetical protein